MPHYALTIIGRDRPGIVTEVTGILFQLGCNIADSSSTLLGGQYAMIQIISHPTIDSTEQLAAAFAPLEATGLSAFVRRIEPQKLQRHEIGGEIYMISVYGSDKPGIVYRVAKELSDRQVNITDLNTKLVGSEERPVYVMMLEAVLPESIDEAELTRVLMALQGELKVDITIRSITPVEL